MLTSCLAVLTQYLSVTDGQTGGRYHLAIATKGEESCGCTDVPHWHREKILLRVFAAGLERRVKLVHRRGIEVRSMAPGRQQKVERTFKVMVAELHRHGVVSRCRLTTILYVVPTHLTLSAIDIITL